MKKIVIELKDRFMSNIFLIPSLIGVLVFFVLPFIIVIVYSLVDNPVGLNFVFLDNYKALLVNDAFKLAAMNTFIFFIISVPLVIIIPLLLALYFTNNKSKNPEIDKQTGEKKPKKSLLKIFFLSPMMVPIASTILIWNIIFYQNGGINEFLSIFGIESIEWMKSDYGRFVIILLFLWKNTGYNMILFIAGLSNVPKELLEAASIDGASNMQKFTNIKLRYLSPTLLFVSIISVINSFKIFREIYLLTGNYPYEALYSLQHFMNNTFNSLDYQKLSAAAVVTAIVVMIIVKVLFKIENILGKDLDDYEDDILHKKINIWARIKNKFLKKDFTKRNTSRMNFIKTNKTSYKKAGINKTNFNKTNLEKLDINKTNFQKDNAHKNNNVMGDMVSEADSINIIDNKALDLKKNNNQKSNVLYDSVFDEKLEQLINKKVENNKTLDKRLDITQKNDVVGEKRQNSVMLEANIKRDIIGTERTLNNRRLQDSEQNNTQNDEFYRRREENIRRDLIHNDYKNKSNTKNRLVQHILEAGTQDYDEAYDETQKAFNNQVIDKADINYKISSKNRSRGNQTDNTFMMNSQAVNIANQKGILNKRNKSFSIPRMLLNILIYAIGIIFLLPILLTVTNSLMSTSEIMRNYGSILGSSSSDITTFLNKTVTLKFIPDMVSLMQYNQLMIKTPEYLFKFWNSIILVVPIALLQIFVACLASYDFARSNKHWKNVIFFLYTIIMIMPYQVTLVPNYFVSDWLGLLNKRLAVILPGIFSPFSIFILTKYMRRIPKVLTEAAKLDGASTWQIFRRIYMPICRGIIFSVFILVFIDYWNMIELPLILLSDENKYPLSIFLSKINTSDIGLAFAAATIYMIPTILIFAYGEDELENGVMYSGDSK